MPITLSRSGQANGAGDALALFLKLFSGEVLTAFEKACVMKNYSWVRNITNGKSASFPTTGRVTSSYHTPGADIDATAIKHNERVISIDGLVIASTAIASIDEAMAHYDVRSIYSNEIGRELARRFDKNIIIETAKGADMAALMAPDHPAGGGAVGAKASVATVGDDLIGAIVAGVTKVDEADAPLDGTFALLRPAQYHLLTTTDKMINQNYGGEGVLQSGKLKAIDGVDIVKTNNMPTGADTSDTYHQADFTKVVGLVSNKIAVGTVSLMDVAVETEWLIRNQAWFTVGKYACGHGVLRPEMCVKLTNAA